MTMWTKQPRYVAFELSNVCPYAHKHKKCPLSQQQHTPTTLPAHIVLRTLAELKAFDYRGGIEFHTYNEPLTDPRLAFFTWQAKTLAFPVRIWTNGFGLTQQLADDLVDAGVTEFIVSAYDTEELDRLSGILPKVPYEVYLRGLDDRMQAYDQPDNQPQRPCSRNAPIDELIINCRGEIDLCCLDWKHAHPLADLNKTTLTAVVQSGLLQTTYEQLHAGIRTFDLCKRCTW